MRVDPEEYRLDFFLEKGFVRKACDVCGDFFWTLDETKTVCNEAPCVNYDFMIKRYTAKALSLQEARKLFIDFFTEKGHTPIRPYPLVARWRSDIFLTDASVVAFQPWVTDGIAPPPANPLVVSQPCARLVDLDKVGLTFGRHLTVFEMGGHHAFNYPDHYVYWKSETTSYCHEFMTEALGIKPEDLTYKESWWAGGGNEGPCLEVISGGLELATLVFMKYKTLDGERAETPIKTVDTGYGIERLAWFSRGTPSAFESIYTGLLDDFGRVLGVSKPPEDLLLRYSQFTGLVIPKAQATTAELKRRVASLAGLTLDEIREFIEPYEILCSILDFTKAIAFILAEGVVPSNVKAGYLARLLIRRTYRRLKYLGTEELFQDLLNRQIGYWSNDFPHLGEMRDEILELVAHEVGKFRETISKGVEFTAREIRSLRERGMKMPVEMLVSLYDERGITPDIVAEVASAAGVELEIPENFYELVAQRHLRETPQPMVRSEKTIQVEGYEKTRRLYYEQPWSFSFTAKVLGVEDGFIILDSTLFYPEGGGQVSDTGELIFNGKRCRIIDTQQVGDVILHRFEGEPPGVGEVVEGLVDRDRRLAIVRHHTATHILIGTVRRVLGKHAWQAGARKEAEMARLDIYHHKRLTANDVKTIEEMANLIVSRRIPVRIGWRDRNEAEREYGFSLYQGGEVPLGRIRIVEIPGWDAEACGGLHCETTEDVGLIKIIKTERIQDGVERIIFTAGPAVLKNIWRIEDLLAEAAASIETPMEDLPKRVSEMEQTVKSLRKQLKRLKEAVIPAKVSQIRQVGVSVDEVIVYTHEEDEEESDYLLKIAKEVTNLPRPAVCIILSGSPDSRVIVYSNEMAVAAGYDAGLVARLVCSGAGGKGGGRGSFGQGSAPREKALEAIGDIGVLLSGLKKAGKK
jgi:alanyl-tRNA synthetase